jgi:hypothetical protein
MIHPLSRSAQRDHALGRRAVLLGALASPVLAAPPVSGALDFRILRNDGQIGTHRLRFARDADTLTVRIDSAVRVGLGPITFHRYAHRATETWRVGRFYEYESETDENGTMGRTLIRRSADGIRAEGRLAPSYVAPDGALPLTHWNRAMLDGPMISGQTGELLRPSVRWLGRSSVMTAGGAVVAEHAALSGNPDLETWYDADGVWAGIRQIARDGSVIRYERG